MTRSDQDCRDMPILRRTFSQLTPAYALELALLDGGAGVYPVQVWWHPQEPSAVEMLMLADAISAEMASLIEAALEHEGSAA